MMISLTLTLLIMFAVVQVFDMMGSGLRLGRATIEMAGQLRSASQRLQQDLDSLTALTLPWADPDAGMGYLEVIERPGNDQDPDADDIMGMSIDYDGNGQPDDLNGDGQPDGDTSFGDIDDVLMFTIRSQGEPLVGSIQGMLNRRADGTLLVNQLSNQRTSIESQVAEVIWWVGFDDTNGDGQRNPAEPLMLYRRQLLVRPDLDLSAVTTSEVVFLNANDISVRPNPTGQGLIANSLSDLTKRENRYAHVRESMAMPGQFFPYPLNPDPQVLAAKQGQFLGEDVILGDVLAFDVRVYDPQAPLDVRGNTVTAALAPGDPGYYRLFTSPSSRRPAEPTWI